MIFKYFGLFSGKNFWDRIDILIESERFINIRRLSHKREAGLFHQVLSMRTTESENMGAIEIHVL